MLMVFALHALNFQKMLISQQLVNHSIQTIASGLVQLFSFAKISAPSVLPVQLYNAALVKLLSLVLKLQTTTVSLAITNLIILCTHSLEAVNSNAMLDIFLMGLDACSAV